MKPTHEQIFATLAKVRPGAEAKIEDGKILALLEFMPGEFNWTVLAYEDDVKLDSNGYVVTKSGWLL